MTHQKQTVEIVLTATQELGCGATFGMTILILLAAHTWIWNDFFSFQIFVITIKQILRIVCKQNTFR